MQNHVQNCMSLGESIVFVVHVWDCSMFSAREMEIIAALFVKISICFYCFKRQKKM